MISVCIATYNGEKYIEEQLRSIIPQLSTGDEIVISDDLSTDNTIAKIHSMSSTLIRIYRNEHEHGYTSNFENAIRHAKGDYIFICDQDDIWEANKVEYCMKKMHIYDCVITDACIIDEYGNYTEESFYNLRKSKGGFINNLIRFSFLGCCLSFRRRILEKAVPFPPNRRLCTHDNWLAIVSMLFGKTFVSNKKLIRYRRHKNNTSEGGLKNETSLLFKIKYRCYLIKWLIMVFLKR